MNLRKKMEEKYAKIFLSATARDFFPNSELYIVKIVHESLRVES